jgi:hypothetical protein
MLPVFLGCPFLIPPYCFLQWLYIATSFSAFTTQSNEDCSFYKISGAVSGVYTIYPEAVTSGMSVYCDMDTDGGSWTVSI